MSDSTIFNIGVEVSRSQFMIGAARNCLGVSVLPMLGSTIIPMIFAAAPPMRRGAAKMIFLNMAGGMSHLDTFDPKPDNADVQGPTPVIDSNADNAYIRLFTKPPLMKHITLFRGMQTNQGAQEQGQYLLHRSYPMRGTIVHPALGAWVMRLSGRRNNDPGFVYRRFPRMRQVALWVQSMVSTQEAPMTG